ncbi:hypothetical protein A0H81_05386 [Grifola frondosa]|uniref:Uncharacterized protein n=1 Tax=Grifola frondosa TaxID=5627 RepID=A0A1C7MDZ1_GRIFR|nr:hypothetical protein A0H81_05386 [Grifola frondosa]
MARSRLFWAFTDCASPPNSNIHEAPWFSVHGLELSHHVNPHDHIPSSGRTKAAEVAMAHIRNRNVMHVVPNCCNHGTRKDPSAWHNSGALEFFLRTGACCFSYVLQFSFSCEDMLLLPVFRSFHKVEIVVGPEIAFL